MLTLANCETESILEPQPKTPPQLKATLHVANAWSHVHLNARATLKPYIKQKEVLQKSDLAYGFTIDTTRVQTIATSRYTSYTFAVSRPHIDNNLTENYMLVAYNNNTYRQYLIKYPRSKGSGALVLSGAEVEVLGGDRFFYKGSSSGSCASIVEYEDPVCVDKRCPGSGRHSVFDGDISDCHYLDSPDAPSYTCTGGGWIDQGCSDTSGGGTYSGSDNDSNTSTGGNDTGNTDDDVVVVPVESTADILIRVLGLDRSNAGDLALISWINNEDNAFNRYSIYKYVTKQNNSPEAIAFAKKL